MSYNYNRHKRSINRWRLANEMIKDIMCAMGYPSFFAINVFHKYPCSRKNCIFIIRLKKIRRK